MSDFVPQIDMLLKDKDATIARLERELGEYRLLCRGHVLAEKKWQAENAALRARAEQAEKRCAELRQEVRSERGQKIGLEIELARLKGES